MPSDHSAGGFLLFREGVGPVQQPDVRYDEYEIEPISLREAAERLGRPWSTVRDWPARYGARLVGKVGRRAFYDFWDLSTIDALKNLGLPIPKTAAERDVWRAESRRRAHAA